MRRLILTIVGLILITACAPSPTPSPTTPPLTEVSVVMGYVPNVQFAPFYLAEKKGYFSDEGLKVKYNWGFEFDGVKLVGANQSDFAIVGGDQILQARAQGVPIVYVGNWYNAFPITFISLAEKGIKSPQDLIGKKVGLPGLFGATYTAWRALLYTQKLDESNINVRDIGFTQMQALTQGTVDVVGAYANNEPVQLELAGKKVNEINVWDYAKLIGNGVATNETTLKQRPEVVQRFVRALTRGVQDSIAHPDDALNASIGQVPEAGGENLAASKAVLEASIPLWKNSRLGETKLEDWQAMEKFMRGAGFIKQDVDVNQAFTNEFVPQ